VTATDHAERYDEVPYPPLVHSLSHPRTVGAMATLFGLAPTLPDRARVLDLGCASGSNIISLAAELPGARFHGVDISASAIARGRAFAAELGLDNVTLAVADLYDDLDLGEFDYVLCHGVFSWVTPALQERLLTLAARHLAPNGVAYFSYNTFPGWHLVNLVRQLFLRRTDPTLPPLERVQQAREVLAAHVTTALDGSLLKALLLHEQQVIASVSDEYIYHEHFVAEHHPVYFEEFAARAYAAGLTYVSDARPDFVLPETLPPKIAAALAPVSGTLAVQQQLDHHLNTRFRWSLLCRNGLTPRLTIEPQALAALHVSLPRDRDLAVYADRAEITNGDGRRITVNDRVVADILAHLRERAPASVPIVDLVELSVPGGRELAGSLVGLFFSGVTVLTTAPIVAAPQLPERPRVPPINRLQAARGEAATSRVFLSQRLDALGSRLIPLLDGTRDIAGLAATLGEPADVVEGHLRVYLDAALILP
jgi:SAM-dependent methyltransferase